jgi:peroxiredoxin Q/BCP
VKFSDKYNLPFPLWSDVSHELLSALGVWGMQKFLGKSYIGIARTTFLVDKNGKIAHVWEKVNPEGHAEVVLDFIENLQKTSGI